MQRSNIQHTQRVPLIMDSAVESKKRKHLDDEEQEIMKPVKREIEALENQLKPLKRKLTFFERVRRERQLYKDFKWQLRQLLDSIVKFNNGQESEEKYDDSIEPVCCFLEFFNENGHECEQLQQCAMLIEAMRRCLSGPEHAEQLAAFESWKMITERGMYRLPYWLDVSEEAQHLQDQPLVIEWIKKDLDTICAKAEEILASKDA